MKNTRKVKGTSKQRKRQRSGRNCIVQKDCRRGRTRGSKASPVKKKNKGKNSEELFLTGRGSYRQFSLASAGIYRALHLFYDMIRRETEEEDKEQQVGLS